MNGQNSVTISSERFAEEMRFELIYTGRGEFKVSDRSVYRPGLQLAGFFNFFDPERIILIGLAEYEYLRSFSAQERSQKLEKLFSFGEIPAIVLCRDLPVMNEMIEQARAFRVPVFRSSRATMAVSTDLTIYFNQLLALTTTLHGTLMEVFGVGVLLTGQNGIGKSETAMELVKRGHRLVADDNVLVKSITNELIGTSPDPIRYFLEIRGIGVINVRSMYGSGAVLQEKSIDLVIELKDWTEQDEYDRLGTDHRFEEILGARVDKYVIPVRPGRNLAIIVEIAARDHLLKAMGYDAAQELVNKTTGK